MIDNKTPCVVYYLASHTYLSTLDDTPMVKSSECPSIVYNSYVTDYTKSTLKGFKYKITKG